MLVFGPQSLHPHSEDPGAGVPCRRAPWRQEVGEEPGWQKLNEQGGHSTDQGVFRCRCCLQTARRFCGPGLCPEPASTWGRRREGGGRKREAPEPCTQGGGLTCPRPRPWKEHSHPVKVRCSHASTVCKAQAPEHWCREENEDPAL